jgi:hypothetical protein
MRSTGRTLAQNERSEQLRCVPLRLRSRHDTTRHTNLFGRAATVWPHSMRVRAVLVKKKKIFLKSRSEANVAHLGKGGWRREGEVGLVGGW